MMSKKMAAILMVIMMLTGMVLGVPLGKQWMREHTTVTDTYPRMGIVTVVDHDNDLITITDSVGFDWLWEGAEDWYEGDLASMIMDTNGTESITDDIIVDISYSGWLQDFES